MTYTYDDNDRLITEARPEGSRTYAYDDNGNTISKTDATETTVYGYDYENRLVLVDTATTDTLYDYDADGIRVSSETNGAVTDFLVDKNRDYAQVLEERDTAGTIIVEYTYGDDLISQERGGADYCYLYDGQMSTRQLVDENEDVANTYTYDAFGIVIDQAGVVANHYMYTGLQYDPNAGFYYLRARWMNPETGRLNTVDPWSGNQFYANLLNKYLYAVNNPLAYIDPNGDMMTSIDSVNTIFSLAAALSAMHIIAFNSDQSYRMMARATLVAITEQVQNIVILLYCNDHIALAENIKHHKKRINKLINRSKEHSGLLSFPPEPPHDDDPHHRTEIRAWLNKAKRIAKKKLQGKTRDAVLNEIELIAKKAGVILD